MEKLHIFLAHLSVNYHCISHVWVSQVYLDVQSTVHITLLYSIFSSNELLAHEKYQECHNHNAYYSFSVLTNHRNACFWKLEFWSNRSDWVLIVMRGKSFVGPTYVVDATENQRTVRWKWKYIAVILPKSNGHLMDIEWSDFVSKDVRWPSLVI